MRNRAGIIQRFPTGTDEVEYSNGTKTESKMGCGLGCGGHRQGDILESSPEGVRNQEEFYRAEKIINLQSIEYQEKWCPVFPVPPSAPHPDNRNISRCAKPECLIHGAV